MPARHGTRRTWRYVTAAAVTVTAGSAFYVVQSRRSRAGTTYQAPTPLQRDAAGRIIPPSFPHTKSRLDHLAELRKHSTASDPYDLLVIGGGATGTGIALDAATRGLRVALVERDDFSSGTSSKSTKLVHGGVRYLEKAFWNLDYNQYELVREALRERSTFLDVAPHLAKPLPILLPVYNWWQLPYFWAGTKAYDLLASSQGMGLTSSYLLGKKAALDAFPLLKKEKLTGALVYYDGQQNDARVNVSLAMTAAMYGATILNHAEVTKLEKDAGGRICGARVRDTVSGDDSEHVVYAKGVINATGPYSDAVEKLDDPKRKELVAPSSGVHIVLPKEFCPDELGILQASSDGRVIFFLPWEGRTIAGTTDSPCAIEREPVPKDEEINFILNEIRKFLAPEKKPSRDDVLAAWSGTTLAPPPEPLPSMSSRNTDPLFRHPAPRAGPQSQEHRVPRPQPPRDRVRLGPPDLRRRQMDHLPANGRRRRRRGRARLQPHPHRATGALPGPRRHHARRVPDAPRPPHRRARLHPGPAGPTSRDLRPRGRRRGAPGLLLRRPRLGSGLALPLCLAPRAYAPVHRVRDPVRCAARARADGC